MKARDVPLLLFIFGFSSCISYSTDVPTNLAIAETDVETCLTNRDEIPSLVERYNTIRDLNTEDAKIDYLIDRFRQSNSVFIRNDVEYGGRAAAKFLRWKLDRLTTRYGFEIETAEDFIDDIASMSRVTGDSYLLVLSDGSRHYVRNILYNELTELNSCLRDIEEINALTVPEFVPAGRPHQPATDLVLVAELPSQSSG